MLLLQSLLLLGLETLEISLLSLAAATRRLRHAVDPGRRNLFVRTDLSEDLRPFAPDYPDAQRRYDRLVASGVPGQLAAALYADICREDGIEIAEAAHQPERLRKHPGGEKQARGAQAKEGL